MSDREFDDRGINIAYNNLFLIFPSAPKERILHALSVVLGQPESELVSAITRDNRGFKPGDKVRYYGGGAADQYGTIMRSEDQIGFMFMVKVEGESQWSQIERERMRLVTRFEDLDFGDLLSAERPHADLH